MSAELIVGDDFIVPVTLKKNGATFNISNSAVVSVAVIKADRSGLLSAILTSNRLAVGANWAQSLIIVNIPAATTALLSSFGAAKLEIQVYDTTKQTWFADITITKSNIP